MVMSSMLYITESETQYSSVNWDENKIYQLEVEVEVVNDSSALCTLLPFSTCSS